MAEIKEWMSNNYLKLNDAKTEFIVFGSTQQRRKVTIPSLNVGGTIIAAVDQVRDLGLLLDTGMSMDAHIRNCTRLSVFHLRNIRCIRKYLNLHATKQLVHAFITSHLDMFNASLFGLPQSRVAKLQKIQNAAARLVTGARSSCHITPILKELHWLPVKQRIVFKLLITTYKVLNGLAPEYLLELIQRHVPRRSGLRSNQMLNLLEVRSRRSWGDRAMSIAAPRVWNSIPNHIRTSHNLATFKTAAKTYLMCDV